MKRTPGVSCATRLARAIVFLACILALAPHLSAEITLVSRLSDAQAPAMNLSQSDDPPPQMQTDFLPASLSNSAMVGAESGAANGHSASNSSIDLNNSTGSLQVTGDGTANAYSILSDAHGAASAKLIVLRFTVTDSSFLYSLTGQLTGSGSFNCCATATAKLVAEDSTTLFEVMAGEQGPPSVVLSEMGLLSPGNYTFSIELNSSSGGGSPPGGNQVDSSGKFTFALGQAPTPTPSPTASPTPTLPPAQALNLSTRMLVQAGDGAAIGGFIITGTDPKQVAFVGLGPSLNGTGISNLLADPVLELHGPLGFTTVVVDDYCHWNPGCCFLPRLASTNDLKSPCVPPPLPPPGNGEVEPFFYLSLDPGAYTVIMRGNGNPVGVGLVEMYDLSQSGSSKLANLSTRAFVNTGAEVVIAGMIIGGNEGSDRIVVRGLGPSLASSGASNVLANPVLELHGSGSFTTITNDNWQDDPVQAAELMSLGLAPTNDLESGIVVTLPPGSYTALLSGVNNGTGIGLVEVYDLGSPAH